MSQEAQAKLPARAAPLWIRNATVLDGTGRDPFVGDVVANGDGLVVSVGPPEQQPPFEVATEVDGSGLALAPGFVDLHSHSDLYTVFREAEGKPPIGDSPKLVQGCTAQVFGQDGISAAPVSAEDLEEHMAFLAGLDGVIPRDLWTWRTFAEYHQAVRRSSVTRTALLVGHATIRRLVMGDVAREASETEIEQMQAALAQAFDEGACGFSSGLVYVPAAYASTDEVAALCQVVASRGLPFFVHVRSESDRVVEATDEVLEVAARTGCHLHYSHIKAAGSANWHKASALLDRVAAAREAGVSVTADVHPYVAGSTSAIVLLPPWVQDGGHEAAIARLRDPAVRERLRRQLLEDGTSFDNWWRFSDGWAGLQVARCRQKYLVGKSFAEVITATGVKDLESQEAFDVVFDLLASENLGMSLVSFNNVEVNVVRFLSQEYTSIGTDAVVDHGGHPHPRLHGTFPRVLGRYVRLLGTLSLPEAVHKVTGKAASVVGWGGVLGRIAPGLPADLVLFDPETIADRATFESPWEYPVGIEGVWVGSRRLVEDGDLTAGADVVAGEPPTGGHAGDAQSESPGTSGERAT